MRLALDRLLGILSRQALLPLQVFPKPTRPDGEVPGQHGHPVLEDVHVGDFVTDVDEPHHASHGVRMVELERVVDGESVHVDDRRLEPRLVQQGRASLDQLPLGRHQEDAHLQPLGLGVEDLEVQLDVRHVERHVLLRLPADDLPGVRLLHPVHLDLFHDHVPAPDRRDDGLLLHSGGGKQTPDRLGDDPRVHDLTLDDGVCCHLSRGHLDQLRLATRVVDDGHLDDARPDIEADGGFFAEPE